MRTLEHINIKYFKYACDDIGKETPVDINAKCIICGDSDKNKKMKRLHLYTKTSYDGDAIKCFNCEWTGNMFTFLREVDSSLFELYKKETREKSFNALKKKQEFKDAAIQLGSYSKEVTNAKVQGHTGIHGVQEPSRPDENDGGERVDVEQKRKRDYSFGSMSGGFGIGTSSGECSSGDGESEETSPDITAGLGVIADEVFEMPTEFLPASEVADAVDYLQGRGLDPKHYYYSGDWITFNGKNMPLKHAIIVPLWVHQGENIMYGFQARAIETKFFYTYIPEENSGFKVWNWYGLDKTKPTFIFESAFDAESSGLPMDRICAALGADLNDTRLAELSEPIFCFDNQREDETSRRKTVQLLKKGYRCLVWDKTMPYKDTNDAIRGSWTKAEVAKYILTHLESGMTGIIKAKLKR